MNWGVEDLLAAMFLLTCAGIAFWLLRKAPRRSRIIGALLIVIVLAYIWVELAVGVFTDLGT